MTSCAKKTVLVVDDAATVRLYHRSVLESVGLEVEEAADGSEGLEKAARRPYDLLLVDVNMPRMDGYTMVRRVRESAEAPAAPVLMIGTEAEARDREQAYQAGANFYLTKPARPEDLAVIASMLAGVER